MNGSAVVSPPALAAPLRLAPFRALQLDPSRIGDPASARLYARPYRTVAMRVGHWIERGDIVRDSSPALYLHEYTDGRRTVRGVVGALDLSRRARSLSEAAVLPHEGVHPGQVRELGRRMREMQLNPAPILLTQRSPASARQLLRVVRDQLPNRQYLDRGRQLHRIWTIRDADVIAALNEAWRPSRALLADGHHRYAAYLANQLENPGGPNDLGLAMLVDETDTPFHLGAIHRVITGIRLTDLRRAAHDLGLRLVQRSGEEALAALAGANLAATDGRSWVTLVLPIGPEVCPVDYVHNVLIPALPRAPRQVLHDHATDSALARTRRGRDLALLLPRPTLEQIWAVVEQGRLLPEKATSFQPKPHAGVFMRSLRDAQPVH